MNLLFLVDNVGRGGGNYSLFKFAEHLSKLGHNVFFCTNRHPAFAQDDDDKRLPSLLHLVIRFRIPRLTKGFGLLDRMWSRIYDRCALKRLIDEKQIDWVFGMQQRDAIRAMRLGKAKRVRVGNFVFESPGYVSRRLGLTPAQTSKTIRAWKPFAEALARSDVVFANSRTTKQEVESWLQRSDVEFIHPGINGHGTGEVCDIGQKRHQIIYIGRLATYKNVREILLALQQLNNPPTLVICGDGETRAADLQRLARDQGVPCVFRGWVSELEKWKEIKRSLFMVFPSSLEGFGMPPGEALSCKIPCVVADIPIMREVYGDYVEYFQEHSVADLARVTARLLADVSYRTERGQLGYEYIKDRYSWSGSAAKIAGIIKDRG